LYGLDRFSEDLDFTLLRKDPKFDINRFAKAIELELRAYDFEAKVEHKVKSVLTPIESAFIKADSQVSFLVASSQYRPQKGSVIKVKIEIDTDAVPGFQTEAKQFFWPQPFSVLTCNLPSLFAGKIHAAFCRGLRGDVKGRDWYDFLWYIGQRIEPNWVYLEAKLRNSMHWTGKFSRDLFRTWAKGEIEKLDIKAAKADLVRFLRDPRQLDGWSHATFNAAIDRLK